MENNENENAISSTPPIRGRKLKCLFLGDSAVGKSALVHRFRTEEFSQVYIPTIWNNFSAVRKPNGSTTGVVEEISLEICDTGGQAEFDRLRPLCYADVDVFIICFSVISPVSFQNVSSKWVPEIKRHGSVMTSGPGHRDRIILLVGTKADLRSNTNVLLKLSEEGICPVSESQAMKLAKKIGAKSYIECSSLGGKNVKEVFDYALTWGLNTHQSPIAAAAAALMLGPRAGASGPAPGLALAPLREQTTNTNLQTGGIKMRGASGHLARWKSYNNQRRKQYTPSTKLKRFMLMFAFFK